MNNSEIEPYLVSLDTGAKNFKENLFRISWYMRGGVTVNDLMFLYSHEDRELISKIIKENIEITEKTQMPLI
jgi:hypothetical protein